jgi:hypothetical protein
MFVRGDISILGPDLFRSVVAILTAPAVVQYEQRTGSILQPYLNLHSNDNPSDFLPVSAKPRGWELWMTLDRIPTSHLFARGGLGSGWLCPSLSSVLANMRARMWDKREPLQMTTLSYLMSQAQ